MKMKKKILILIGVLLVATVGGKTILSNASSDHLISEEWTTKESSINKIELLGCSQDMNVEVKQTDALETTVQIEGIVSEKVVKSLKDVKFSEGKLSVTLGTTGTLGLSISPEKAEAFRVKILLGINATVENYLFNGNAAVFVKIPRTYEGRYDLNTNKEGRVLQLPKTNQTDQTLLKVDTLGDIRIEKE